MALQLSVTVRNARLDAIETAIGTGAVLKTYDLTAGAPANCAAAITGTVIATITCPSDYMDAASSGAKAKSSGSWADASADGSGTMDFFRLFASDGTTCHMQGTVGTSGADMIVDNASVTAGQSFTVTGFTLTDANA